MRALATAKTKRRERTLEHEVPSDVRDWRDRSYYPRGHVSNERWAWEFLRRRKDYRADFQRWSGLEERAQPFGLAAIGGAPLPALLQRYGLEWVRCHFPNPDEPDAPARFSINAVKFAARFPELADDPLEHAALALDAPSKIAIEFDPELPIQPQLARAESLIAHVRRHLGRRKRLNPWLYITYLQILDGLACGSTNENMAIVISASGPRWVNDSYRKALAILDSPSSIAHSTPER